MRIDLAGRVAVVTGICGRLGPIWANALLSAGAEVIGIDRGASIPEHVKGLLEGSQANRFEFFQADVVELESLKAVLRTCVARGRSPTILVNNAGIDQPPSRTAESWVFEDIPSELSAAIMDVNGLGVLKVCQVFGPEMVRQGLGSIINIGSLYGSMAPDPRLYEHLPLEPPFLKPPAYAMSKAGVAALTRYLAVLWGPLGVRVNTLSPGGVSGSQDDQFRKKFSERVPLRRMAKEADLKGPLLFLASDMSSYLTGIELLVDGGYVCL